MGVEILDTADSYGDSYDIINRFHRLHSPFKLMTKFKLDDSTGTIVEAFKRTQCRLKFERLYNYSFHAFKDLLNFSDMSGLAILKAKGLIESIGVSVYGNDEFRSCLSFDIIDTIQLPFNLLDNYCLRGELMKLAKRKGKTVHVRSVYLQGLFYKKEITGKLVSLMPDLQRMNKIARENQMEIGELALRYALSVSEIDGILIGVDTVEQLRRNFDFCSKGPLGKKIIEKIHSYEIKEKHLLSPVNWK